MQWMCISRVFVKDALFYKEIICKRTDLTFCVCLINRSKQCTWGIPNLASICFYSEQVKIRNPFYIFWSACTLLLDTLIAYIPGTLDGFFNLIFFFLSGYVM